MTEPTAIQAERREIFALMDALNRRLHHRTEPVPLCGRPTKAGTPCKRVRLPESVYICSPVVAAEYAGYMPPGCSAHVTDEERAEHDRICALTEAVIADGKAAIFRAERVHCWAWEVTDEHRARAEEARNCPDPELAHRMGMRLLREWQAGRCGMCAAEADVTDHSHETGLVRGFLCRGCNTSDGVSPSHPDGVLARYRQRNPASILGLEIRYYSPWTGWAEPEPRRTADLDRSPGYLLAAYLADGQDALWKKPPPRCQARPPAGSTPVRAGCSCKAIIRVVALPRDGVRARIKGQAARPGAPSPSR